MELSVEPNARRFELGWKDREITGDLESELRVDTVQQLVYVL
jgi:hypothetical protein